MANIPVGHRIPVTEYIPLPKARPFVTDVPVQDHVAPISNPIDYLHDVWSSPSLIGTDWLFYPLTRMKEIFDMYEDKHGWLVFNVNSYEEVVIFFGVLVAIGFFTGLAVLGLERLFRK